MFRNSGNRERAATPRAAEIYRTGIRSRRFRVTDLFLVALGDTEWNQFCQWYSARGMPQPMRPAHGIWISDGALVAGCCIYQTDGPYAFAEHFSVRPDASGRVKLACLKLVAAHLASYSCMVSKFLIAAPNFLTGLKILERAGFKESDAALMSFLPTVPLGSVQRGPRRAKAPAPVPESSPVSSPPDEPMPQLPKRGRRVASR